MALFRNRILGLAIEEHAILVAEVHRSGRSMQLVRAAEFALPEGVSLADPQQLGLALSDFLRRQRFAAKHAVAGVPARWLMSKTKTFPPAEGDALAGMVKMEVERSFATHPEQLAVDYAGAAAGQQPLFITALRREKLDQVQKMAQAAGLHLASVTPASLALADAMQPPAAALLLHLRPDYAEVLISSDGRPLSIRHLPMGTEDDANRLDHLAGELNRQLVLLQGEVAPQKIIVCDALGLDDADTTALKESLSLPMEISNDISVLEALQKADRPFAAAAAVALAILQPKKPSIDFLNSRLADRRKLPIGRRGIIGAAAGVAAVFLLVMLINSQRNAERELAALKQSLADMKPSIELAQEFVDRVTLARQWTDRRPRSLDPLRALTQAMPPDSGVYVTNLVMREDKRIVATGKAADERSVLAMLDHIRGSAAFEQSKLLYMREVGNDNREIAFSITFNFKNRM